MLVSDDVLLAQNDNSSNDNNAQNKASTATKKSEGSFIGQRSPFEKKKSLNITKRSKRQLGEFFLLFRLFCFVFLFCLFD